jgi:hypothetical protein
MLASLFSSDQPARSMVDRRQENKSSRHGWLTVGRSS